MFNWLNFEQFHLHLFQNEYNICKCNKVWRYQPLATWHFGSLFGYFDEGRGGWDTASKTMHGIDWTGASASVWAEHLPVSATSENDCKCNRSAKQSPQSDLSRDF